MITSQTAWYCAHVIRYGVEYDDGDTEDLKFIEVMQILQPSTPGTPEVEPFQLVKCCCPTRTQQASAGTIRPPQLPQLTL